MKSLALLAAVSIAVLRAQTPAFEVASVKECKPGDRRPPSSTSPGRISLECQSLKVLIQQAYDVFRLGKIDPLNPMMPSTPVEGGPGWIDSALYSIDARADGPQTAAMMRGPMMQALLEERFHLKTHRETREVPVYIMTVDKGGPKLQPTTEGNCQALDFSEALNMKPGNEQWCVEPKMSRNGTTTVIDIRGVTLGVYVKLLHPDGRPVIDRTGLTGTYDIHLVWEAGPPSPPAADGGAASDPSPNNPSIVAMREQLGLRLDPGKGPVEFFVIDHIERPTAN